MRSSRTRWLPAGILALAVTLCLPACGGERQVAVTVPAGHLGGVLSRLAVHLEFLTDVEIRDIVSLVNRESDRLRPVSLAGDLRSARARVTVRTNIDFTENLVDH